MVKSNSRKSKNHDFNAHVKFENVPKILFRFYSFMKEAQAEVPSEVRSIEELGFEAV